VPPKRTSTLKKLKRNPFIALEAEESDRYDSSSSEEEEFSSDSEDEQGTVTEIEVRRIERELEREPSEKGSPERESPVRDPGPTDLVTPICKTLNKLHGDPSNKRKREAEEDEDSIPGSPPRPPKLTTAQKRRRRRQLLRQKIVNGLLPIPEHEKEKELRKLIEKRISDFKIFRKQEERKNYKEGHKVVYVPPSVDTCRYFIAMRTPKYFFDEIHKTLHAIPALKMIKTSHEHFTKTYLEICLYKEQYLKPDLPDTHQDFRLYGYTAADLTLK